MYIKKIVHIKGIGKYVDYTASKQNYGWDGNMSKFNLLYADNASGKTTLTQIIKSISSSSDISEIRKRKTFNYTGNPSIKLKVNNDPTQPVIEYHGANWNHNIDEIIVFDTYFVERNVYILSPSKKTGDADSVSLLLGEDSVKAYEQLSKLKMNLSSLTGSKGQLVQMRNRVIEYQTISKIAHAVQFPRSLKQGLTLDEIEAQLKDLEVRIEKIKSEMEKLKQRMNKSSVSETFIKATNKYLAYFAPGLELSALYMKTKTAIVYGIKVHGYSIRSKVENSSLKRILSEGEKNALAFSFFLAKLEILPNLDKYLVVFDDPLSSMDAARRSSSIYHLCSVANKVEQFILLSHDKLFVRDMLNELTNRKKKTEIICVLKIGHTNNSSAIFTYDVAEDTKTGMARDLKIVNDFRSNVDTSIYSPEEVAGSLRRLVEGFLRLKYSSLGCFDDKQMLGGIINYIENSVDPIFDNDKKYIDELREIKDYSNKFHHSDASSVVEAINNTELKTYCDRVLKILLKL